MRPKRLLSLLLINLFYVCGNCDLFTTGAVLGVIAAGSYLYKSYEYVTCSYQECCTDQYIDLNLHELEKWFTKNLYGQQIAQTTILRALRGHFYQNRPPKPLVMSFHGSPGTGKNYVATSIADHYYKNGNNSKYYYFFNGRDSFTSESKLVEYQVALRVQILTALVACSRSMFVFDEVEKMPEGILDVLVPFLDYSPFISVGFADARATTNNLKLNQRIQKNHAIFIFLSNVGSSNINQRSMELWENGKKRDETILQDFENLISFSAFNEKGGLRQSDTIKRSLIDHYVPFLPLEEVHVKKCLIKMFQQVTFDVTDEMIAEGMTHVTFGPPPHNLYSKSGCKRLEQKVATIVYKYYKSAKN